MDDQPGVTAQRRRTPAEIEQIAAAFAGSGLNRTEFCRRQHLALGTLNRYLQRQHQDVEMDTASGGMVSVEVADPKVGTTSALGCGLAVVLACGRRVEVETGFDAATLQRLVLLLENM
jgi:hypothetical protein